MPKRLNMRQDSRDDFQAWAGAVGRLLAWIFIAAAPCVRGRSGPKALANTAIGALLILLFAWLMLRSSSAGLPAIDPNSETPGLLTGSRAAQALLNLLA